MVLWAIVAGTEATLKEHHQRSPLDMYGRKQNASLAYQLERLMFAARHRIVEMAISRMPIVDIIDDELV